MMLSRRRAATAATVLTLAVGATYVTVTSPASASSAASVTNPISVITDPVSAVLTPIVGIVVPANPANPPTAITNPAPAPAARNPVVFVHGYNADAATWNTAVSAFMAAGYGNKQLYAFEYDTHGDIPTAASQMATFVAQVKAATGATQVDVVNHSMGGLVTEYYVNADAGAKDVAHVASLAGANHGTLTAGICGLLLDTGCQQMTPGSQVVLDATAGDETPGTTAYATWSSSCDTVIQPNSSTALAGAANTTAACVQHGNFPTDPTVLSGVISFLAA